MSPTPSWPKSRILVSPLLGATLITADGGSVLLAERRPTHTAPSPVATTTASPPPSRRSPCTWPLRGSRRTSRPCSPLVTHSEPKPAATLVVPLLHGSLIVRRGPLPLAGRPMSRPVRTLVTHTREKP